MRWKGRRQSQNVEDRRGSSAGGGFGFPRRIRVGRGSGLPGGGGGRRAGFGSVIGLVAFVLIALYFGVDPSVILAPQQGGGGGGGSSFESSLPPGVEDELAGFASVVLADTEDYWGEAFTQAGGRYREPSMVLFTGAVDSHCGYASSAVGPFYCPRDAKIYLDLGFFQQLSQRLGAPGDFAQAYVIAHEVGHHVQNLTGLSEQVQAQRGRLGETEYNQLSVRVELQADCYAGAWARYAQSELAVLEPGDLEEALTAAGAIGDDTLQRQASGRVRPDAFTHGTSEQRVRWFRKGLESGDPAACDTFSPAEP